MEEEIKKTDYSYTYCDVFIKMAMLDKKQYILTELAKSVNIAVTSPIFNKIIKILKNEDIILIKNTFGNAKLVEIDFKRLKNFIDELDIVINLFKYFDEYHFIGW
jgi:hypothetical protein